jgi:hypothetical protein
VKEMKLFKLKKEAQRVVDYDLVGYSDAKVVSIYTEASTKRKIRYAIRLEGDGEYGRYLQDN